MRARENEMHLNNDLLLEEVLPLVLPPRGGDAPFDKTVEQGGGLLETKKEQNDASGSETEKGSDDEGEEEGTNSNVYPVLATEFD